MKYIFLFLLSFPSLLCMAWGNTTIYFDMDSNSMSSNTSFDNSMSYCDGYFTEENHNTHLHYEIKVNGKIIDPVEDPQNNLLIDPQEMIKNHNEFPEIVVTPTPEQTESNYTTNNDTDKQK